RRARTGQALPRLPLPAPSTLLPLPPLQADDDGHPPRLLTLGVRRSIPRLDEGARAADRQRQTRTTRQAALRHRAALEGTRDVVVAAVGVEEVREAEHTTAANQVERAAPILPELHEIERQIRRRRPDVRVVRLRGEAARARVATV